MKKKLLATAVAGVLAAPAVAVAADGPSVTLYGRINNALNYVDDDAALDATLDVANVSSRLGVRGEADLGSGLKAIGRYEFSTFTDVEGQEGSGGIDDTRLGYVGLSGPFGTVTVGNQWSAYYNAVGTHLDPTVTVGAFLYSTVVDAPYRASNTLKYANGFGPVNLEIDTRFSTDNEPPGEVEKIGQDNGEEILDGYGIGLSGTWNFLTLAAAYDQDLFAVPAGSPAGTTVEDETRLGVAARADWENYWGIVAYQMGEYQNVAGPTGALVSDERDEIHVYVGGSWDPWSAWVGYGQASVDSTNLDPSQISANVTRSFGSGFRLYFEGAINDTDAAINSETTNLHFGMRFDF